MVRRVRRGERDPGSPGVAEVADSAYIEWRRMQAGGLRHLQQAIVPLYARTRLFRAYEARIDGHRIGKLAERGPNWLAGWRARPAWMSRQAISRPAQPRLSAAGASESYG
jgi:hypothetical protein